MPGKRENDERIARIDQMLVEADQERAAAEQAYEDAARLGVLPE